MQLEDREFYRAAFSTVFHCTPASVVPLTKKRVMEVAFFSCSPPPLSLLTVGVVVVAVIALLPF